jgi:hypothetical protein
VGIDSTCNKIVIKSMILVFIINKELTKSLRDLHVPVHHDDHVRLRMPDR